MSYQLNSQCWEICLSQGIYPKNIVLFLDMVVQRVVETDENMLIGKVLTLEPGIISTHISYLHLNKYFLDNKNKHDTEAMETNQTVSYTIDRNISIPKIKRDQLVTTLTHFSSHTGQKIILELFSWLNK